ncbi:MAG: CTP-dependent riboflavin kinase [Candidatus Brockarchaeota archaeon]|nr:CTP-dependent riboflavin kinase [Candidatus Brockarchaeota archaeon]
MTKNQIILEGKVFSGKGKGSSFVSIPWATDQFVEKLGFKPYPGTLNIRLLPEHRAVRKILDNHHGIEIVPREGFYPGKCFKALVADRVEGAIVIPQVPFYPEDTLEIIAPVNLRKTLGLKDDDEIGITVLLE